MPTKRLLNQLLTLIRDTRGDESVSSVGRLAFIAVPLIVALLLLGKWVIKQSGTATGEVNSNTLSPDQAVSGGQ